MGFYLYKLQYTGMGKMDSDLVIWLENRGYIITSRLVINPDTKKEIIKDIGEDKKIDYELKNIWITFIRELDESNYEVE